MSGKLMGDVFALKLSERQRLVLLALADHAADNGTGARPGIARICWKTDLKRRTVERILSQLRATGVIEKVSGGGHRQAVEYKIILSAGEKKPAFSVNDENESAANLVAGERKPEKVQSAANLVAGERTKVLPEKNHSAAKNGNNQPPKRTLSAAIKNGAPTLTVIEPPAPLPAKRRALSLSETERDELFLVGKVRAREAEKAAAKRIFELWEKTLNFTGKEREFSKGALQAITKKFREGFTEKDLNAAIYGYQIAAPEETENTQKSGNFSAVLRDVEQFRQIYFANLPKGEK